MLSQGLFKCDRRWGWQERVIGIIFYDDDEEEDKYQISRDYDDFKEFETNNDDLIS